MSEQNTSANANTRLVRRAIEEIWNGGNYDLLDTFIARDLIIHGATPDHDIHGAEGVRQFYGMLRDAFPDLHFTIEDQIANEDRVVTRWLASGTHQGSFQGIPPTGRKVTMSGIDIDRFANGRVVECWPIADELGLLQQLGAIPAPALVGR